MCLCGYTRRPAMDTSFDYSEKSPKCSITVRPDQSDRRAQASSSSATVVDRIHATLHPPPTAAAATTATAGHSASDHRKPIIFTRHSTSNRFTMAAKVITIAVCLLALSATVPFVDAASSSARKEPSFVSRSDVFKFKSGDTILLPCEVSNADSYMVAWRRGVAVMTAGAVKVSPDPRIKLINGYTLQISNANTQDAGDYVCQIATMEVREITHTVEILTPPKMYRAPSASIQSKKGGTVRVECLANGNPTPNITWTRNNNVLPNGEEKFTSTVLFIEAMDQHKGGLYVCTASNGVGTPVSAQVNIQVLYPPEIEVDRPVVFSGEGAEAMLYCIVHGDKQPDVTWFKETMQLDTTERHIMENRGARHTLIIRKVHMQDFGNYSCVAENPLGKTRKTLQLTGKPNIAIIRSNELSPFKDRYNMSWIVHSHTPIEEAKLSFRKLIGAGGDAAHMDNDIDRAQHQDYTTFIHRGSYSSNPSVMHWPQMQNDWRDVVLPSVSLSNELDQPMSYMIRDLEPDQKYEARIRTKNRYGWSDQTAHTTFKTALNDGYFDQNAYLDQGSEMRVLGVTNYGSSNGRINSPSRITTYLPAMAITAFVVKSLRSIVHV